MIDKHIRERIEERAFAISEWRRENNVPGSDISDWLEAESEIIIDRRTTKHCPVCGFKLIAKKDDTIFCLRCEWRVESKREADKEVPDVKEVKWIP